MPYDNDETEELRLSHARKREGSTPGFVVVSGIQTGQFFSLTRDDMVVGRSPDCDIVLHDHGVSRRHARITRSRGGSFAVTDLGSRNGTFCNAQRIEASELREGDKIQVGRSTIMKFGFYDATDEAFLRQQYEFATRDGLTGLYNRRYFQDQLQHEFAATTRQRLPLCVLLIEVNGFKELTKLHGHVTGDAVLKLLGEALVSQCRDTDIVSRIADGEFAVLMRETPASEGLLLAKQCQQDLESRSLLMHAAWVQVKVSVGMATTEQDSCDSPQALLKVADANLAAAKRADRDRLAI